MADKNTETGDLGLRVRLQDLQVFISAVELGGMKKAAIRLGISQPFVTQTIKRMEAIFGVPLVERTRSGIGPTIYGEALLKRGLVAFDEVHQTINDIQSLKDINRGDVRFSAPQGVGSVIFADIVEQFIDQNPEAALHLRVETSLEEGLVKLRNRYSDFTIGALPRPLSPALETDDLKIDRVVEDEIVLVVGKDNPLLKKKDIRPVNLIGQRWILPPKEEWYRSVLVRWFKSAGLAVPSPSVVTSSAPVVAKLTGAGKYVTLRSRLFARYHGLGELRCNLPTTRFSWSIITIKGRTLSPIAERFIEFSRDRLRKSAREMGMAQ